MTANPREAADDIDGAVSLRRHRIAISIMFAIAGMVIGTWTARIPAIQHNLALSDGQLSAALLALALGGLVGMRVAGRLVDHYGSKRVMTATSTSLGAVLVLTAYAPNLPVLGVVLFLLGLVHGTLNIGMNVAAVACQNSYQRPIMTSIHALFSIGGMAGAATAAACAYSQLTCAQTFTLVGIALTAAAVWAVRWIPAEPTAADITQALTPPQTESSSAPRRRIAVLGLLALCALISEGAAADWSSVYLHRLSGSPTLAAIAYAAFAGCMTLGRLAGDRVTAALSPVTVLRSCGLIAGGGLATGILIDTPIAAIIGIACLGLGLSCVIPLLYTAAGALSLGRPGAAVARVAAIGYLGYVIGPVIIGTIAARVSLGHALLLLPVLALLLVGAARVVRPTSGTVEPGKALNATAV